MNVCIVTITELENFGNKLQNFALQEEQLLSCCDVTTFHRLLANEMPDCDLKSIRNLQIAIKKLNDSTNKGKIKDCGMERTYIDEWRSYLTNAD